MTATADDVTAAAVLFRGLADPARLAILRHLALGEHRVVDLTAHLGLAQSTVSGTWRACATAAWWPPVPRAAPRCTRWPAPSCWTCSPRPSGCSRRPATPSRSARSSVRTPGHDRRARARHRRRTSAAPGPAGAAARRRRASPTTASRPSSPSPQAPRQARRRSSASASTSVVEVSSGLVILWQFRHALPESRERQALRLIALSFFALAAYVARTASAPCCPAPSPTPAASASPWRRRASRSCRSCHGRSAARVGRCGSNAVVADGTQTLLCTLPVRGPARRAAPERRVRLGLGRPAGRARHRRGGGQGGAGRLARRGLLRTDRLRLRAAPVESLPRLFEQVYDDAWLVGSRSSR